MSSKIVLNCLNFQLRDEMRARICTAAESLFHHDLFVCEARLTLEGDYSRNSRTIYRASLLLELRSSEIVACGEADELMPAIASAVSQAERSLVERFHLLRQKSGVQANSFPVPSSAVST